MDRLPHRRGRSGRRAESSKQCDMAIYMIARPAEFAAGKASRDLGDVMSENMLSRFHAASDPDVVSFGDLEEAIGADAWTVVDVREPHEFATATFQTPSICPCRRSIPRTLPEGKPLVLICQAGARSRHALNKRARWPRGCQALCRGHERLAFAQRSGDPLKAARTTTRPPYRGSRSQAFPSFRGPPAT